jgi:hypothetical protein
MRNETMALDYRVKTGRDVGPTDYRSTRRRDVPEDERVVHLELLH